MSAPRSASRRAKALFAPVAAASAAAVGAAGIVLADKVLGPPRSPTYDRRIVGVAPGEVSLQLDDETLRPGTYGLDWPGGHAVVGEALGADSTMVRRRLLAVDGDLPVPGPAAIGHVHRGDPASALALDFEEISLDTDVGAVPAWVVPSGGDCWAVAVHGWGGSRESSLSYLPMLRRLGITAVVPAYRNDPDAPPSPDRRYHLGASEWQEVEAAMSYALAAGARQLVLLGWSMGGAIVLQAYVRSPARAQIAGIVLDSPVLDWRAVLSHQGAVRHIPPPLTRLAMRIVEARIRLGFDELDWLRRAPELDVPVLVFHGDSDPVVPCAESRALEIARPDLVRLVSFAGAGHIGSWSVDSSRYEDELRRFLERVGDPGRKDR